MEIPNKEEVFDPLQEKVDEIVLNPLAMEMMLEERKMELDRLLVDYVWLWYRVRRHFLRPTILLKKSKHIRLIKEFIIFLEEKLALLQSKDEDIHGEEETVVPDQVEEMVETSIEENKEE